MKRIKVKCVLPITIMGILNLFPLPLPAAMRQQLSPIFTEANGTYITLTLGDIWDRLRGKKGKRGSRGGEKEEYEYYCMISPGRLKSENGERTTLKVWSDKPLFLWQGEMEEIEVYHSRSEKLVWNQVLEPSTNQVTYQGEQLQPGEVYFWRVDLSTFRTKVAFRLMNEEERDRVSSELEELEDKLKAKGASESEIIVERASYFVDKDLWSDALREIYSVQNPSGELAEFMEKINAKDFCPPPDINPERYY